MSKKLATKRVSPNMYSPLSHTGRINRAYSSQWVDQFTLWQNQPPYTKLNQSHFINSLIHFYSPPSPWYSVLYSVFTYLSSLSTFSIFSQKPRGEWERALGMWNKKEERSAHCKRVMRNPLQANGIQRQRLANFQSNYLVINALRGCSSLVLSSLTSPD